MGLSHLTLAPYASPSFGKHAFVCLWCFVLLVTFVAGGGNVTDRLALLEFKAKITQDPMGVTRSWNDSIHFCMWKGVTCGRRHQRVTRLDLQSKNLVGSISPHVGNLSFLRNLILQNNSFIGIIPTEVGRLRRLERLALNNNSISGQIPSNISNCSNLLNISLQYNQLVGEIPAQLAMLSKLQEFSIHTNYNLSGNIPPSFGNLSFLERFNVVYNNLGGSIPDSFGQLTKLRFFAVDSNRLSGTIPSSIFNLSSIRTFSVGTNQIRGSLPWSLGITLPNLQFFSVAANQFTGSIPVTISNATNLNRVIFAINKLTGNVPSLEMLHRLDVFSIFGNFLGNGGNDLSFLCSLTNASNLRRVTIAFNNLGGDFPDCISNFSTALSLLDLQANKLSGSIPPGLGNLINLEILTASNNKLSGHIPFEIGDLPKLQHLDLAINNFSGYIPTSLGNLKLLGKLFLEGNILNGVIPSSLAECQYLRYLNFSGNNLRGSLPSELMGLLFSPIGIDLSANLLTGVLPLEIGNWKNLEVFDISQNMMSGGIPASLGNCLSLELLAIRRNFFRGPIPSSLETLRGIQFLDLSNNNLSGAIPKFLDSFRFLQLLDLSYNHLEGEVPTQGVFKNTSATSINGNGELCGGIPEFQLPKCELKKSKKRAMLTLPLKLTISALSALTGIALLVSFLLVYLQKKRKENTSSNLGNFLLNVSYQSLLRATDGFSLTNLIGKGSFGSVYKGILHDHGALLVAVKVINLSHHGASKSFLAECEALRNIRHKNLVKVLTSCSSADYQNCDFKAVVYEFMVNGNLDEWLHLTPRTNEVLQEQRNLSLLQRMNIAIDIANALQYLHHECETPIVHCDLKPSNVLLDDEMTARVGDFGLARFLLKHPQDCSTDQSSSIEVRGTMGYAAPEYGLGNEVSTFGDVYSYGILLLEMFTGKKPTDNTLKDGFTLHDFAKVGLQEQMINIVDPVLLSEGEDLETETDHEPNQSLRRSPKIRECSSLIMGIGLACSVEIPSERMNIGDVVAELHSVRRKLLGTNRHREALEVQVHRAADFLWGGKLKRTVSNHNEIIFLPRGY